MASATLAATDEEAVRNRLRGFVFSMSRMELT